MLHLFACSESGHFLFAHQFTVEKKTDTFCEPRRVQTRNERLDLDSKFKVCCFLLVRPKIALKNSSTSVRCFDIFEHNFDSNVNSLTDFWIICVLLKARCDDDFRHDELAENDCGQQTIASSLDAQNAAGRSARSRLSAARVIRKARRDVIGGDKRARARRRCFQGAACIARRRP